VVGKIQKLAFIAAHQFSHGNKAITLRTQVNQ
jgi:hypothetical protein